MPRVKTPSITIECRAVFEQKIDVIAQQEVSIQMLAAERDAAKETVLKRYNDQIDAIQKEQAAELKLCAAYAKPHWPELAEKDKRSAETPLATYGFRTGQKQVAKRGKRKEEDIAADLHDANHDDVLSVKPSLNKPAILKLLESNGSQSSFV